MLISDKNKSVISYVFLNISAYLGHQNPLDGNLNRGIKQIFHKMQNIWVLREISRLSLTSPLWVRLRDPRRPGLTVHDLSEEGIKLWITYILF